VRQYGRCLSDSLASCSQNAAAQYNTELATRAADMLVTKWGTKHYPLPDEMKAPFMRQVRLPDLKKYPSTAEVCAMCSVNIGED